MAETDEQDTLLRIRALLALERNYLAEERTALAEFRTGLAIALISVPATGVVAYIFYIIPGEPFLFNFLSFFVFAVIAAIGIWMGIRSRSKMKRILEKKKMLRQHQVAMIKSVKAVDDLLGKLIVLEEQARDSV